MSTLENAALHYLERFASSSANLRRVMMRKAERSLAHWGGERAEAAALVDSVLAKLSRLGYLDDAAYARQKAAGLHRRGRSGRAIRAALAAKGVAGDHAEAALGELAAEAGDGDRAAALNLARRRRLGPFRKPEDRAAMRTRDLAALARAGFDFDTARQVIDASTVDSLEG
ncbi:MAG: RecX family transcriptional regulator [Magnetospirillum sp.]|nr:RecX family transcriptional regulator [Magnetospirillum sp.]